MRTSLARGARSGALAAIYAFRDYSLATQRILMLAAVGTRQIAGQVKLERALYDLETDQGRITNAIPKAKRRLDEAKHMARLARIEIKNDFPILHAHCLVALWGALEAAIEDIAVAVLEHEPSAKLRDPVRRVKLSVAEMSELASDEQCRAIIHELQRGMGSEQRMGVGTFESLLGVLGLSGAVDATIRKRLLALQQLRHVIVHRASKVDKRLVTACPWLRLKVGSQLRVNHREVMAYMIAAIQYTTILKGRLYGAYAK